MPLHQHISLFLAKPSRFGIGLLLGVCLGCSIQAGRPTSAPARSEALLVPSSNEIEMGAVSQGGSEETTFFLTNAIAEPVEVAKLDSSCACLELDFPMRIERKQKVLARVKLDLNHDAEFSGRLCITVRGLTNKGELAFSVMVNADVRPK